MKTKCFAIVAVFVLVLGFGVRGAWAEALDFSATKWEASGQLGAAIPKDGDSDAGMYVMGRVTYDLTKNLAIGATTAWSGTKVVVDGDDWGDASNVPLLATVVLKMPLEATENHLVPYLVGGVGVLFWSLSESSLLKDNNISVDSQASFAAQIGGGLDYFINERVGFFGEATYMFSSVETSISAPGLTGTLKGDTDAMYIGAGAKVRF